VPVLFPGRREPFAQIAVGKCLLSMETRSLPSFHPLRAVTTPVTLTGVNLVGAHVLYALRSQRGPRPPLCVPLRRARKTWERCTYGSARMPHRQKDLSSAALQERVRVRLTAQLTNNPVAYRTLARLLYAFVSHGYKHSLTFTEIETRINEGPQYFATVAERNIENFACRKVDRPRQASELCEYARFVALTLSEQLGFDGDGGAKTVGISARKRPEKLRLFSEILAQYDVVKIYLLARDIDDERLYRNQVENHLTSTRASAAWQELASFYDIAEEATQWSRDILVPKDKTFGFYYTYRFTGSLGNVSCAHITITAPSLTNTFCMYETATKTRRYIQASEGVILPLHRILYFVGRIKDHVNSRSTGLNCVALPVSETDDIYSGLVLMRDTQGAALPIASRIEFVRTDDEIPDPTRIGIKSDGKIDAAIRRRILNKIDISVPDGLTDHEGNPLQTYENANFMLRWIFMDYNRNHGKFPFVITKDGCELNKFFNPFEYANINFNTALRTWSDAEEKGAD
jgi:hypothetical protein